MRAQEVDASVIVPTLGRIDSALTLSQKLSQLLPRPKEVIFVFQRSEELSEWTERNTNEASRGVFCDVVSASVARNFGASHASGRYLVFLDDDCLPVEPDWLAEIVSPLELGEALLCTGAVLGWESASGRFLKPNRAFMVSQLLLVPWGNPASGSSSWCQTVAGGNFSVERRAFLSAGGFSLDFGSPSLYEETEFSLRLTSRKKKTIWFNHRASVHHHQQASGGMRSTRAGMDDDFILAQKKILLEAVFGRRFSATFRYQLYKLLRRIRSVWRLTGFSGREKGLTHG